MATSNRERIAKGLDLFAEGMYDFVDQHMTAAAPGTVDWLDLMAARDEQKHGVAKSLSKNDPAVQLRVLTEEWRVFADSLSREHSQIASLLRGERNRWAHNEKFTPRQTLSTLDHMSQLLQAAGASTQAEAVDKLWQDTTAAMSELSTRKAVKESESIASIGGEGLKPWREVVEPHNDITSGNFNAAEYAANLGQVVAGLAEEEYGDPVEFFRRTYLTEGLQWLLKTAARRLSGDLNAAPVVNLQTNFGGGKTHSMLALYHLASGKPITGFPDDLQSLLAGIELPQEKIARAAFVGTDVPPGKVRTKPDGTEVYTLWGDLAWQLAGSEGYALVADADQSASNPGEQFRQVLELASPCLILIDEWVAYGRQLLERDKKLIAGTFETQFTFAQYLTEAVASVSGAMLAVSLPQSEDGKKGGGLETGGALGRQTLDQLSNVVGRTTSQWHPATQDEAFEIVRRRLFKPRDAAAHAQIAVTSRKFIDMYNKEDGFPKDAVQSAYRMRMEACYPIHPELFDRLYQTWSTLERFQRTRGVLRLMSTVIHALWNSSDTSPLIMPGTMPLSSANVIDELTHYLEDQWRVIVDTDVAGDNSTPTRIDAKPIFGSRYMTQRLARTLFFGSAPTLGTPNQGIERQHILLGTAIPGDTVNNFTSALQQLSDSATFLYSEHGRWWYNTQPSMTRTAKEYADSLQGKVDDVYAEIVKRLKASQTKARGDFAAVYPAPVDPGEINDREQACLVICHPQYEHANKAVDSSALEFAKKAVAKHGGGIRENRNMLAFLAPDRSQLDLLMGTVRSYMAWSHIVDQNEIYNLTGGQLKSAQDRKADYNRAVDIQIDSAYIWVIAPEQPDLNSPVLWQPLKADTSEISLATRASKKLKNKGDLYIQTRPAVLRQYLNGPLAKGWEKGHISVGDLWVHLRQYHYLPRLKNREILDDAIEFAMSDLVWRQQGFALATGYDEATGEYQGLAFFGYGTFGEVTDSTLLVRPNVALQQQQAEEAASKDADQGAGNEPGTGETPGTSVSPTQVDNDGTAPTPKNHYFHGVYQIDSEQYAKNLAMLQSEILPHLAGAGSSLRLTVKVEATNAEGFPESKIRTVSENARQMKFLKAQFVQEELEFGEE